MIPRRRGGGRVALNPGYTSVPEEAREKGEYLRLAFFWTPIHQLEEAVMRLVYACRRVAGGDVV